MWFLNRRPKKKNKESSLRFERSDDPRRWKRDWDNSINWKRNRKNRIYLEDDELDEVYQG